MRREVLHLMVVFPSLLLILLMPCVERGYLALRTVSCLLATCQLDQSGTPFVSLPYSVTGFK